MAKLCDCTVTINKWMGSHNKKKRKNTITKKTRNIKTKTKTFQTTELGHVITLLRSNVIAWDKTFAKNRITHSNNVTTEGNSWEKTFYKNRITGHHGLALISLTGIRFLELLRKTKIGLRSHEFEIKILGVKLR